jgi:CheY-like chemotaxis protein/HPt (histidine-containing phosphotransfer) domain-containing protein
MADPLRLVQILDNLVSNALKFTAEGSVGMSAILVGRSAGLETLRLSVQDSGIGIDPVTQQRLFQPFEQADAVTTRSYGGTGLGLSICRRLAEMMGGSIELQSVPGKGTTVTLELALTIDDTGTEELQRQATTRIRALVIPGLAGAGPLVLAVDDHPTNRELLGRQIAALGLQVQTAADGVEALARWEAGGVDMIVTDCNMPEMDGYALSRAIRGIEAQGDRPRTPIIAWTANVLPSAAAQCHAAGMDDVLTKPAELERLRSTLSKWLPPTTLLLAEAEELAEPLEESVLLDLAGLARIAASSVERDEILLEFMAHNEADLLSLGDAHRVLDFPACARIAHRMSGSSQLVGAQELATACAALERAARQERAEDLGRARVAMDTAVRRLAAHVAARPPIPAQA